MLGAPAYELGQVCSSEWKQQKNTPLWPPDSQAGLLCGFQAALLTAAMETIH